MNLIIDTIITPYSVAKYNAINKKLNGNLIVFFLCKTDINRNWKEFPNIEFRHEFLEDFPIRLKGSDITTFHFNPTILKRLKSLKPKHITVCGWDSFAYYYALYWAKKNNISFTLWSGSTKYEKSWRRTVTKPLVKWMIKNSNDFIAYGTRAKKYLMELGADSKKIQLFYNTVDIDFFKRECNKLKQSKDEIKKKLGINTKFVLIYNGQLIKRKGIYQLIEGFRVFQKDFKDISLIIVGNGKEESELKKIIKNYSIPNIFFIGFVQFPEIPKFYSIADIFILPSKEEVWGLVANEAMACGLPVVVSDKCGCAEDLVWAGKNGYILKNITPPEIVDGLKYIFSNNLQERNNSLEIIENYKLDKIIKNIFFNS